MSYAELNRRVNYLETAIPNDCPACRDAPKLVICRNEDELPEPCPVCGREQDSVLFIRITERPDGPQ
jgi:hypothetical protein